jgi:hypothetical protein
MKKHAVITTYYCYGCQKPSQQDLKNKFNYDGDVGDIYVNFSNEFDPFNMDSIPNVGVTRRRDLVYGKIFVLRKFIEENILGKYEYLSHIDYSDTKFKRSCGEMVDKFIQTGEDIIVSTEKNCWPYLDAVSKWMETNLEDKEFFYLNSGAIISKTNTFYEIIKELENICLTVDLDFWDDQGVWQYYHLKVKELNKDSICDYFFSTAMLDETYYTLENNTIKTKFNTEPYLIHDNSSFSLNLIKQF